jgi:replication-associated recombination protein RarA
MTHLELINVKTMNEITNYLSLSEPPGLILQGLNGLGKSEAAKYIASKLLNCMEEELYKNPDFFETTRAGAIKSENMDELLANSQRSAIGIRKVFIIHNAHTITAATQNRLLKLLEDHATNNILILLSATDRLLDTIKSRCHTISFYPLAQKSMKGYLNTLGVEEEYWNFLCNLTECCPWSIPAYDAEIKEYISQLKQMYNLTVRSELLRLFHLQKEKDNDNFFTVHGEHQAWNIRILLFPFQELLLKKLYGESARQTSFPFKLYTDTQALKILEYGLKHLGMLQNAYTKNDYFNLVRFIIQVQ